MSNRNQGDNGVMARWTINIRKRTFEELDEFRLELEPGRKESWDEFFRRIMREGKLEK